MRTYEEQKALVSRLNVMDDIFFQKVAEDPEVCEEILRIILKKPALKVLSAQPQRFLRNLNAHSVVLDLICQEENGAIINVEVQKSNDDDHQKRVRFNISNIDTTLIEKGITYKALPDVYVIFISQFDLFRQNCTIYHVRRSLEETDTTVYNGIHEIYVNTAVNDHSDIAELMQYFRNSNGSNPKFQKLSKRVNYLKESQKEVNTMSSVIEEYTNKRLEEALKETAINFLKNGASVELVAKSLPSLSLELIQQLKQQLK